MSSSKESNKKAIENKDEEKSIIDMFDNGLNKIKESLTVLEEKLKLNENTRV